MSIKFNSDKNRFELVVENHIAFATVQIKPATLVILHVEAPPALRGTGAAGQLMQGMLDYAATHQLKLEPVCPYAVHWLGKKKSEK